jgi:hypothetical protein
MTKNEAHAHLDRLREGHPMPVSLTTQALYATGDIIPRISHPTLCFDGNEPQNNRTIQMESKGTETGFSYSAYLDSQQNKGDAT